jgi:hypothetical protein
MSISSEDMNQMIGEITKTFYSLDLHDPNETVLIEQQYQKQKKQLRITFIKKNINKMIFEPFEELFIPYGDVTVKHYTDRRDVRSRDIVEGCTNQLGQLSIIITFRDLEETRETIKALQSDWFYQKDLKEKRQRDQDLSVIKDEVHSLFYSIEVIKECIDKKNEWIYNISDIDVKIEKDVIEKDIRHIKTRIITIRFDFEACKYPLDTIIESIRKALKSYGSLTYDNGMDMSGADWVVITIEKYFHEDEQEER